MSWKAKQQNCIAHSSAEGEFIAASKASLEAIWLQRLLKSCGAPQPRATTLYEDNRACQLVSESPAHRERSKHIDLRVYSLKEEVKNGVVRLFECPTTCIMVEVFAKSHPGPKFIEHREDLLGNAEPLGAVGTDSSEGTTSGSGAPLLSKNQDPTIRVALHVALTQSD